MVVQLEIDHAEVERQKQFRRDLWEYKPVDHIPVFIWPTWTFDHTIREQLEDGEVQFEDNLRTIKKCLKLLPDDYIPWARVTPGYMTIATMFGMQVYWSDDPSQPPGTDGHLLHDLKQVYELERPTLSDGLMPEMLRRLRRHSAELPQDVYVTGIDSGGPLNSLKDLLDTNLLYTGFYDDPETLHYLLNMVTDVQLEVYQALVEAVGGIERMTSIDFDPVWAPEKYKSFVSDDICATIGPAQFREFSIPYNNRLFAPWGSGLMHNCGPNPCMRSYLDHRPKLKGLNLSFKYSQGDFQELKEIFSGWGMFHILLDNELEPQQMIEAFRTMMETLAPDVVGVPLCFVDDTWADPEITQLYWEMRKIADEYAANMKWLAS
jgi:Uroporphyrinogen decarboxylase (URO-D)